MKECDHYSLICQVFQHLKKSYTGVTITFCTPSYEMRSACLGVMASKCNKETLGTLLAEYSLPWSRVTHVTITGVIDKLDLGLNTDICALYHMDEILHKTCLNSDIIVSVLSQEVLQTNTKLTQRVYNHVTTTSNEPANDTQKIILSALVVIFKPFYDAYKTLSGESHPTVGLTIPVFRRIRDVLAKLEPGDLAPGNQEATSALKSFCDDLLKAFQEAFQDILSEGGGNAPIWTIPTDPRLIHMGGLSDKEKETVTKTLTSKVAKRKLTSGDSDNAKDLDSNSKGTDTVSTKKEDELSTMGGIFWGDEAGAPEKEGNLTEVAAAYAKANLDRYFTAVKSKRRIEDPLAWWNANYNDFPELGDIARKWFGATAVGRDADKRNQYTEEKIEMMVFLHENAKLLLNT